ncbi:MAG: hypothetical protein JXL84_04755 [Deltaproteobacteria bacterium]|nr:hypothetical protein [Deltaproteobacteria bacterium]
MIVLGMKKRLLPWVFGLLLMGFLQHPNDALARGSGSGPEFRPARGDVFLDTQGPPRDAPQREYRDLQRQLKELLRELENLEKEAREKLQKDIFPLIRQEIERLRKWLRDLPFKREEDKPEPLRTRAQGFPVYPFHESGRAV